MWLTKLVLLEVISRLLSKKQKVSHQMEILYACIYYVQESCLRKQIFFSIIKMYPQVANIFEYRKILCEDV